MKRAIFEPDHEAFRESCRTFVDRTLRPHHEKHMANHEFGREVWLELGKQGFLGLNVPEEYGGAGVNDLRFSLILAEELSSWRSPTPRVSESIPTASRHIWSTCAPRNRSSAGCQGSAAAS